MQDQQNTRPRVEKFKRLYRTIFNAPRIIPQTAASAASSKPPLVMPVLLGIEQSVRLVYDPTIPACLINSLERYANELQDSQLDDAQLRNAETILNGAQATISWKWIETEADAGQVFWGNVASPIEVVCRSLGFWATYRNAPMEQNIMPEHAWAWATATAANPTPVFQPIAIFEHKSPTVADRHFPEIVALARDNKILQLSTKASSSEIILAKLILASLAKGLKFCAILSFKDFIFIHLVQDETGQWEARISDIVPITAQTTPIVAIVLALVLHSRNDGHALEYHSLEEEAADSDNVSSEPAEGSNSGSPGAGPHAPTNPPTGGPPSGHTTGGQMPVLDVLAVSDYWEPKELSEDTLASLLNTMDGVSLYWDMRPLSKKIFRPVRRDDSSLWGKSLPSTVVPRLVTHSRTDHHVTPPASPPMIPFVLRLDSEVGRGAVGPVYQGCFHDLSLRLVVKILPADCMDRELKIWRQLRHLAGTGIPGLFGAYAIEGKEGFTNTGALVQQYGGSTVSSFDVLSPDQRDELYRIVVSIHEAGVEHGDLAPMNVTLKKDGGVMVIDFSHSYLRKCTGGKCKELQYLRKELGLQASI
ncbi:hypothetical protein FRC04_007783 [Tulasnella sp. 424]|nr:hypothetical protein FRC04_007783 [Tulasnella sp. 424]KAG8975259.1 hypothetical protein FRC05_006202 [Tulasnella sp. 425]